MGEVQRFLEQLETPSEEFSPIPFWFFNDRPDEEKIRRQLADYVEKGVNGFVLHPRIGVPKEVPYLSEAYFRAMRFILETAAELGMKVVLYDEGMYPSGSAHGMVTKGHPEFASRGIRLADDPGENQVITRFADGRYLVYGFTRGTIRGIHFGEDDGEEMAPLSADILNSEAVDRFISLTHDRYFEELGEYFGSTVIAFFTDEPCALGRNAGGFLEWVPGLEEEILSEGGCLEELEGLFAGRRSPTSEIYHRLIKRHLRENFYARLSGWCESHGISLMGHPEASDDIEEELYFHIPGQDLIMRRVSPETGGVREFDSVQAKLSADIARLLGRRRNANECFGVCNHLKIPWYFTGYDMKWYINWLGLRGVNLFVPHAFYYSLEGKRKEERPPDVGANNIWWPHYRRFSDYIKRISWLMTDSASFARLAVLCDNNRVPYRETAELYERQVDFHYLPEAMLDRCRMEQGRLCIGDCAFDAVLDVYGGFNRASQGRGLEGVRVFGDVSGLVSGDFGEFSVYRTVVPDSDCPALRAAHGKKDGVEWYLLSNEGPEEIRTRVSLSGLSQDRAALGVDLWTGKAVCEPGDGGSRVFVALKPCEMRLILLAEKEEAAQLPGWGETGADREAVRWETDVKDLTEAFVLTESGENRAVYTCIYPGDRMEDGGRFTVTGEEMAECFCNGKFVDVSFYGPHTFCVGPYLGPGDNEIRLVFTGNAVNLFGPVKVPFGLGRRVPEYLPLETFVTDESVTLSWKRPEDMPGDAELQILLNGREAGRTGGDAFVLEGLRSKAYYDVQTVAYSGDKVWRRSRVLHLHTT